MVRSAFACIVSLCFISNTSAVAKVARVGVTLPPTGTPSAMHNPPCSAASQAKNIGEQIVEKGLDTIGKSSAALGLGDNPFNTRRLNMSVCVDLCVVLPSGTEFTVEGNMTPFDSPRQLPTSSPQNIELSWAAFEGPVVESTDRGDVICYTAKNWSHDRERKAGLVFTY